MSTRPVYALPQPRPEGVLDASRIITPPLVAAGPPRSRTIDTTLSQHLYAADAGVTEVPYTLAAWYRWNGGPTAVQGTLINVDVIAGGPYVTLVLGIDGTNPSMCTILAETAGGSSGYDVKAFGSPIDFGINLVDGQWHHLAVRAGADPDGGAPYGYLEVWVDAVNVTEDGLPSFPVAIPEPIAATFDNVSIGCEYGGAQGDHAKANFLTGQVNHVATWPDVLTGTELSSIFAGGAESTVRTDLGSARRLYVLHGDEPEPEFYGNASLTSVNAPGTAPEHAPVADPSGGGPGTFTRSAADSISTSDAAKGVHVVTRVVADSTSVSDAAGGVHVVSRGVGESTSVSDSAAGNVRRFAAAMDSTAVSDAAGGVHVQGKAAAETLSTTDAGSALHATTRLAADSTSTSDAAVGSKSKLGTAGDAAGGSDAAAGVHVVLRGVSDSAGVSEAVKGLHATARGVSESTSVSDVAVGTNSRILFGSAADSAAVSDAAVGRHSVSRSVGDSATPADAAAGVHATARAANDSTAVSDAAAALKVKGAGAADTLSGSDVAKGLHAGVRGAVDSAGVVEAITRVVNMHRGVSDSGGGTDVAAGARGLFLSASAVDVAHATDAVGLMVAVTRRAADSAGGADAAGAHAAKQGAGADVAAVIDVATALRLRLVGVVDTAPVSDSAGMARRWAVFASDTVAVPVDQAELLLGFHGFAVDVLPPVSDGARGTRYRDVPETQGKLSAVLVIELASVAGVTSATLVK